MPPVEGMPCTPVRQRIVNGFLCGLIVALLHTPASAWATINVERPPIAKGVLLVAHPSLVDPNFRQTVVLLIAHGPEGTVGVVLNRPTDIPLSQALPGLALPKDTGHYLFVGGPVARDRMTMLARLTDPLPDMHPVIDGIYAGGSPAILKDLITQPKPSEAFRVFAGMAGWAPGQLAFEIRQGAWATLSPDASTIFDHDPASLWAESLRRIQPLQHLISHSIECPYGPDGSSRLNSAKLRPHSITYQALPLLHPYPFLPRPIHRISTHQ